MKLMNLRRPVSLNLVAVRRGGMNPLHLNREEARADSRRLLRFKDSTALIRSHRHHFLNRVVAQAGSLPYRSMASCFPYAAPAGCQPAIRQRATMRYINSPHRSFVAPVGKPALPAGSWPRCAMASSCGLSMNRVSERGNSCPRGSAGTNSRTRMSALRYPVPGKVAAGTNERC